MKKLINQTKYWWLIGINIIYPLILTNKYFNVAYTKIVTMGILVVFFMVSGLYDAKQRKERTDKYRLQNVEKLVVLYGILNMITLICSRSWFLSLFAVKDKYLGCFFVLGMLGIFLIMRLEYWDMELVSKVLAVGAVLVSSFGMLQYLGVNLFHLYDRLSAAMAINFLSTLGNTAIYGRYLILVYPVVLTELVKEEGCWNRFACVAAVFFGPAVLVANADAAWLGFFVVLWLWAVISWKNIKTGALCFRLYGMIFAGLGIWGILYQCMPDPRNTSRIARFFIQHWYMELILAGIFYGGYVILHKKEEKELNVGRIILGAGFCGGVTVLGMMLYFSLWNRTSPLGGLENYLRFSMAWGTERGYVWTWCMHIFGQGSVKEKMIGYGQGMVPLLLQQYYGTEMKEVLGYNFVNAHNLYLHMLLGQGILGVMGYGGILLYSIRQGFKGEKYYGLAIALTTCGIMDMVCIYEAVTSPWIWMWIGLIASRRIE